MMFCGKYLSFFAENAVYNAEKSYKMGKRMVRISRK